MADEERERVELESGVGVDNEIPRKLLLLLLLLESPEICAPW